MIEVSVCEIEGVRFLNNIKILEPDTKINGVGVHRIALKLLQSGLSEEFLRVIKLMGLRRVDVDYAYCVYLYTQYPIAFWQYKTIKLLLRVYWKLVRFLYDNARFFKEIPAGECFSWKYFTPYIWFKMIRKRMMAK